MTLSPEAAEKRKKNMTLSPEAAEKRKKNLTTLIGLTVPLVTLPLIFFLRTSELSLAMISGAFALILLAPMIGFGVWGWKTRNSLDEMQLRIRHEAALVTQNLTLLALSVVLGGSFIFGDSFLQPDVQTAAIAYIFLFTGAGWFTKRRYT